jgi:hypothetical protein
MAQRHRIDWILVLMLLCSSQAGCPSKNDAKPSPSASVPSLMLDAGPDADTEEDVRPVYPADEHAPVDPIAARFCGVLNETGEARRSSCCNDKPGIVITKECVRMLSTSLRDKAVTLAAADVDRCDTALKKTLEGCDWVGPFPPELPSECLGLVHGTLPAGKVCRSSLECAADQRCHGAGPTTRGKCGPAKPDGAICGSSVDTLATYTRQTSTDALHLECKGYCNRHECATALAAGAACMTSLQCGSGKQCIKRKCATAAPNKLGESCPGQVCEPPSQCISGKCIAKKEKGEACTQDFECRAGCVRGDGSTKGTCAMKCGVR